MFGNLFNKGVAFLTIPIYTRILSSADYGIINTYSSIVAIASIVLGMTFTNGIRAAFTKYEEDIDDFMSSITFFSILYALTLSTLIVTIMTLLNSQVNIILAIICLMQGFASAMIGNYSMYLMMKFNYKLRTLLLILPNLITTIISVCVIYFLLDENKYLGKIIPSFMVLLIFAILIVIRIFMKSKVIKVKEYWLFALKVSVPIIAHGLALNVLSQSDRIMITSLASSSQTGIYSLIYNFSMISMVISLSLDGVWVPWFIEKLKSDLHETINNKVKIIINIMTLSTFSILFVAPEVLKVLAPSEFWEGKTIVPFVVISSYIIFIYTLFVNIEHYHLKTRRIALNTIVAAFVNLILNYIFIPEYGYFAAAVTTLFSYTISFGLHYKYSRKLEPKLFPLGLVMKPILILLVGSVFYYILINNIIIRWFIMISSVTIVLLKYKEEINTIIIRRKFD